MDIRHDADGRRFHTTVDGHDAEVSYELEDGVMQVTHTGVPQAIAGRGVAAELNRAAFEHARSNGLRVRPLCSYAAAWSQRNADVSDLLA